MGVALDPPLDRPRPASTAPVSTNPPTPPTGLPSVLPGHFDPRFARVFAWWVQRMLRHDFYAVRLATEHAGLLRDLASHPGPVLGVSNHSSWWDPLVFVLLQRRFMWGRGTIGPVEAAQWRRFGFMRKLGLFGIDPADPRAAPALVDHVMAELRRAPRTNFWITPQGQFVDPRDPIRIRPGVSMVAAAAQQAGLDPRAVSIAIEYVFWVDRRPELLIRLAPVPAPPEPAPRSSTSAWHRSFVRAMRANQDALADLARARDPAPFTILLGGSGGRVNPAYDLWQRLRGRSGAIEARRLT